VIGVTILGSTGSIGVSTLDVLRQHPERFEVVALSANRRVDELCLQCQEFRPRYAVVANETQATELRTRLRADSPATEVLVGEAGLEAIAGMPEADYVMAAIVGAAGLLPALAAVRAGKRLLLANKEALVVAGGLFMQEAEQHGAEILPIDSEHNALFQCMPAGYSCGGQAAGIRRIQLTASGGPFRELPLEELDQVTPAQACAHPNWDMGRKISVDSATMMNKGLEVIEACWLFALPPERVQVVLHPQSVIHSMVEYVDGSVLAQLGNPDMRTPIAHALAWPQRIESGVAALDLCAVARLDFEPPEQSRFPCLELAYQAVREGGNRPVVLNAANEVAVEAFLGSRVKFTAIPEIIEQTLTQIPGGSADELGEILEVDRQARSAAELVVMQKT
jgi:1-deoxy-D-xylulose-5-phosphate reductoisomerase